MKQTWKRRFQEVNRGNRTVPHSARRKVMECTVKELMSLRESPVKNVKKEAIWLCQNAACTEKQF